MKIQTSDVNNIWWVFISLIFSIACTSAGNKNSNPMNNKFFKGTYGYDSAFFAENNIKTIELKDKDSKSRIIIVPGYQGRVMTSTADGSEGTSFGWINHEYIKSGKVSKQFNPYGGEERIWLGPEGGPFSIYFPKGKEQVFANWIVPKELDTIAFDVILQTPEKVTFRKEFALINYSGTTLKTGIERTVKLLSAKEVEDAIRVQVHQSMNYVAYESVNTLFNKGQSGWNDKSGILSIWMLGMFNPSESGIVFIPFRKGEEKDLGKIVSDDYFGKVPSDRLKVMDGILFFKVDGKFRSKIGISPSRALPWCGSYDPKNHSLTLLWYSSPDKPSKYVNSKWGPQVDPLLGDVVNSYNDGPVEDGSIMGPFYEIESSSPAAFLAPGGSITHTQRIFHITGDEDKLSEITEKLFNLSILKINEAFN
jgi:hypothetical protein